jgi:protein-S-isoprenylcysteine O-methyltransferase Ste14
MFWGITKADWLFIIPATIIWVAGLVVTAVDFISQAGQYRVDWLVIAGVILGVGGGLIRQRAKRTLKAHFKYFLQTSDAQPLITHGIYTKIRHPGYLGVILANYAIPFVFRSGWGFLVMTLLIPCYLYRIRVEEAMLIERFGDDYADYRQQGKMLIPYVF